MTDGNGGWIGNSSMAGKAERYNITADGITGGGDSFSYTGQLNFFNTPVQVYVCNSNRQFFILRSGNELMYAMTNNGLFLSEMQQVGIANQRLSRRNIPGYYNVNPSAFSTTPIQGQSIARQGNQSICPYCKGWGKFLIEYASQYSGSKSDVWCEQCHRHDYPHYHKKCEYCQGSGYVR